ncbi:MAG TPA: lauroyl acyltransferase [Zetaproteobacteria bacterium]|nr:lauroyl acyltransferase [Zetaproteobacteria bacterium]
MASLLPVRLLGGLGAGLGRLAFYLDARHRRISIRNLTRVYPDRSLAWRTRTARESFAELGRTMLELPHVFMKSREYLLAHVSVEGEDHMRAALAENKGVFLAACHHGNWELGALMFSLLGFDIEFFYRPLRQPVAEAFVRERRERFGATLHARQDPLRWLVRALKGRTLIGLMIDQHIGDGMPVPFLGHMANTLTLPAAMVRKYDAPLVGVALHRIGRGFKFRLDIWTIERPDMALSEQAFVYKLTRDIGKSFEPAINLRPEMWLWSHQRWKLLEEHNKDITGVVYGTP